MRSVHRFPVPAAALAALLAGCGHSGPRPSAPEALAGCRYGTARALVARYCADCHSPAGADPARQRAAAILRVDSYAEWMKASRAIPGRVDPDSLEDTPMPPESYRHQPTREERKLLADWVRRGSPNTPDGR